MVAGFVSTKNARKLIELRDKDYMTFGGSSFSKSDANKAVKKLHSEGFLARAINLKGTRMAPDIGVRYLVMYKRK
jgi:hypothetical protein